MSPELELTTDVS